MGSLIRPVRTRPPAAWLSRLGIGIALLIGTAGPSTTKADVVHLVSGERLTGVVEQVTRHTVVIQQAQGLVTLDRRQVQSIVLDPIAPPSQPASLPAYEALRALRRLESTSRSVEAYSEFSARLGEAKVAVARYLEAAGQDPGPLVNSIRAALHYLALIAAPTTDAELTKIGQDPAIEQCPYLRDVVKRDLGRLRSKDEVRDRGLAVTVFGMGALLSCAREEIAAADRLLAGGESPP